MPNDERTSPGLPRWTGLAVFLTVIAAIAIVLVAQRIPHAKRPTIQPPASTTIVTITSTVTR